MTDFDVLVIGAGALGSPYFNFIAKYTDLEVVLLENNYGPGLGNSFRNSNSQTVHIGNETTNYSVEKTKEAKIASGMILSKVSQLPEDLAGEILHRSKVMVLGVGKNEILELDRRYEWTYPMYPGFKKMTGKELKTVRPYLMEGRDPDEKVLALYDENGHAADFGLFSEVLVREGEEYGGEFKPHHTVKHIYRENGNFRVITDRGEFTARYVDVCAGTRSLQLCHQMGYGKDKFMALLGGHFYNIVDFFDVKKDDDALDKTYGVQKKGIPFAKPHVDKRFDGSWVIGPTVNPMLSPEKNNRGSSLEYIRGLDIDLDTIKAIIGTFTDKKMVKNDDGRYVDEGMGGEMRKIIASNLVYSLPIIGKYSFLKVARNIVPSLKYDNLKYSKNWGIRPQIISKPERKPVLGEVKVVIEDGITFNMAPSPGATNGPYNARQDLINTARYLKAGIDFKRFNKDFPSAPINPVLLIS